MKSKKIYFVYEIAFAIKWNYVPAFKALPRMLVDESRCFSRTFCKVLFFFFSELNSNKKTSKNSSGEFNGLTSSLVESQLHSSSAALQIMCIECCKNFLALLPFPWNTIKTRFLRIFLYFCVTSASIFMLHLGKYLTYKLLFLFVVTIAIATGYKSSLASALILPIHVKLMKRIANPLAAYLFTRHKILQNFLRKLLA